MPHRLVARGVGVRLDAPPGARQIGVGVEARIDEGDADSAATKKLLAGIKSIEIRRYAFATDSAYSSADLDAVRRQLDGPGWSRLIQVRGAKDSEDVDMYILIENNRPGAMARLGLEAHLARCGVYPGGSAAPSPKKKSSMCLATSS